MGEFLISTTLLYLFYFQGNQKNRMKHGVSVSTKTLHLLSIGKDGSKKAFGSKNIKDDTLVSNGTGSLKVFDGNSNKNRFSLNSAYKDYATEGNSLI